jgi:hypothetical protein
LKRRGYKEKKDEGEENCGTGKDKNLVQWEMNREKCIEGMVRFTDKYLVQYDLKSINYPNLTP